MILNDPTWSASLRGVSGSVDIIISDMISFVKGRAAAAVRNSLAGNGGASYYFVLARGVLPTIILH